MATRTDDRGLVQQTLAGEQAGFAELVDRYRDAVVAVAYHYLGSLEDAQDAAQEAFVRAYLRLRQLRDPTKFGPWLRRIIASHCANCLRHRGDRLFSLEELPEATTASSGSQEERLAAQVVVREALASLPDRTRLTTTLFYINGYSHAEIADFLEVPVGTVRSRLATARRRLREEMITMVSDVLNEGKPKEDFTERTIQRLKEEMRQLVAEGKLDEAAHRAGEVMRAQVKSRYGDPEELGVAKTYLTAYADPSFQIDQEAVRVMALAREEQRRKEWQANAAQYGFKLEDLDWQPEQVSWMSETLGRATGQGKDRWGIPLSRMSITLLDARELCQRLRCSPLALVEWVRNGCPILRCWPFARFDFARVQQWLAEKNITNWPKADDDDLEWPIRVVFRAVYDGELSPEQAEAAMREVGFGVWEAPLPLGDELAELRRR